MTARGGGTGSSVSQRRGSDGMTQGDMIRMILELSTELTGKVAAIEVHMANSDQRSAQVETELKETVGLLEKVFSRQNADDARLKKLEGLAPVCQDRFRKIETKDGVLALNLWKKIGQLVLTVLVTAVITYILAKIGIKG